MRGEAGAGAPLRPVGGGPAPNPYPSSRRTIVSRGRHARPLKAARCPAERGVQSMSRSSLRHGAGALILAAGVLLPQTAWGHGLQFPPPGSRGAVSALEWTGWSGLWSFLSDSWSKNRAGIDPNGEPGPSESTQAAPTPPDSGGENRAGIDPDG